MGALRWYCMDKSGAAKAPGRLLFDICLDKQLAAVIDVAVKVSVRPVQLMLFTSSRTSSNVWHFCFLVRSALMLALLRDSTLRMCHRYNVLTGKKP